MAWKRPEEVLATLINQSASGAKAELGRFTEPPSDEVVGMAQDVIRFIADAFLSPGVTHQWTTTPAASPCWTSTATCEPVASETCCATSQSAWVLSAGSVREARWATIQRLHGELRGTQQRRAHVVELVDEFRGEVLFWYELRPDHSGTAGTIEFIQRLAGVDNAYALLYEHGDWVVSLFDPERKRKLARETIAATLSVRTRAFGDRRTAKHKTASAAVRESKRAFARACEQHRQRTGSSGTGRASIDPKGVRDAI